LLLRRGEPAPALAQLELAAVEALDRDQEFETLQYLSVTQAALGRKEASAATLSRLETRAKALVSQRELRRIDWARGEIALGAGDAVTAVAALMSAQQALPAHGQPLGPPSPHTPLLYSAAVAAIKAGRDADAAGLLDRLQQSYERIYDMDAYARSFYLRGQISERAGDTAKAREQYTRFLSLWRNGDQERGWVADAEKKVGR
jgi:tetratricopeptide (TPR) repeat protein